MKITTILATIYHNGRQRRLSVIYETPKTIEGTLDKWTDRMEAIKLAVEIGEPGFVGEIDVATIETEHESGRLHYLLGLDEAAIILETPQWMTQQFSRISHAERMRSHPKQERSRLTIGR